VAPMPPRVEIANALSAMLLVHVPHHRIDAECRSPF
jgi:hypothetical protein